jgi:hypothetical protein
MRKRCVQCPAWAVPGSHHCALHREAARRIMRDRREPEIVRGPYACGICRDYGHNGLCLFSAVCPAIRFAAQQLRSA